jgi:hypothetical protein
VDKETKIWNFLTIIITLITCGTPIFVVYDLYDRGTIPQKQIELGQTMGLGINPLYDLNLKSANVDFKLIVDDQIYDNVIIKNLSFRNSGKAPVVPTDYCEPITVTVGVPWKIIAIESAPLYDFVPMKMKWHRINDQMFEAEPALINPGDFIVQNVYLTNTKYDKSQKAAYSSEVNLMINARITNLSRFSTARSPISDLKKSTGFWGYLYGLVVPFKIILASIFLFWYLFLLRRAGFLTIFNLKSLSIVVAIAILSFSVAEVFAYYIFIGNHPLRYFGNYYFLGWKYNWQNYIIILFGCATAVYLIRKKIHSSK